MAGKRHGHGTLVIDNKGDLLGEQEARGQNRFIYKGDFVNDMMHGEGVMTKEATGYLYDGSFRNNHKHGYGVEKQL